ncbi:hypothetical protein CROQUDRAFT_656052 [Cronartium quercuum f. sp. fusiforme G11]|uniref:HTH CENPB-type domain-containing protein n=1 Tax=Cronartium quercuum f. sp. fusiforme G11 TaxID=708437 RepID=A0A9P6NKY8_9BASI|nr:hypothetical protein CROQUDRAFT_656052 [Cronartium quercuum f. sp. fusiforme G11]
MELNLAEKQCLAKILRPKYIFPGHPSSGTRQSEGTADSANKKRRISSMDPSQADQASQSYAHQQQSNHYNHQNGLNPNPQMHNLSDMRTPLNFDLSMANPMVGPSQDLGADYHQRQDSDLNSASTTSTPSTTPNTTSSKKREVATLAQKIEILTWYQLNGENQTQTAKHFDQIYPELKLSQPLISSWLKNTTTLHNQYYSTNGATSTNRRRQQKTKHVQVTEALEKWCQQAVSANMDLNGDVIREKWREFARHFRVPESNWLKLSEGWLSSFKERNGLKGFKRQGHGSRSRAARPGSAPTSTSMLNAVTPPAQPLLASHSSASQVGTPLMGPLRTSSSMLDTHSHRGSPMMGNSVNRMSTMLGQAPPSRPPSMMESHHVLDTLVQMTHMQ